MNTNTIIVYDWETGSRDPEKTQPLQLSAVAIDPRTLTIIENSIFNSYIAAEFDEAKCLELGIDPIQDEALAVNKITKEKLIDAPSLEIVWNTYVKYVQQFKTGKSSWGNPISCGYNNANFDNKICARLCRKYGPWDEKWCTQNLYHPIHTMDIMHDMWRWTESRNMNSISMDSIREWMGIDSSNAHNAVKDVLDTAYLAIKLLNLYRHYTNKVKFEDSFAKENVTIGSLLKKYYK